MALKVHNTLTRKKEEFKPIKGKEVRLFVCGPTVYDYSHLGHAKTYIQFDIIAKYLKHKGYKVNYVMNITDIDDKIIKRAQEKKIDWKKLSTEYEQAFLEDMKELGIDSVNKYARATDYIPQIIKQIKVLLEKDIAYKISDGYYFDLTKFKDYGKLAKRKEEEEGDALSRIDENKEKRNKGDFCIWKFSKRGEPVWKTELGEGRPGWHIEDTAITEKEHGPQYDVHGGAVDLIFPHHEAEIAIMESVSGKEPLVRYWLHTGFLVTKKTKMSKSLGNFWTIRDVLEKYDKKVVRYMFTSVPYRHPLDFSEKLLEQSKNSLQRIHDFVRNLEVYEGKDSNPKIEVLLGKAEKNFEKAMDNDFETPNAMTTIYELIREVNTLYGKGTMSKGDAKKVLKTLRTFDTVLGILEEKVTIPKDVQALVKERETARKNKEWDKSDKLRDQIKAKGYSIDDAASGTIVKKLT